MKNWRTILANTIVIIMAVIFSGIFIAALIIVPEFRYSIITAIIIIGIIMSGVWAQENCKF